jgi:hypothetical protein
MTVANYLTIGGLLVTITLALYNTKQLSVLQAKKAISEYYENTLSVLREAIENIYKIAPTTGFSAKGEGFQLFFDSYKIIDSWVHELIGIVKSIAPYLSNENEEKIEALCKSALNESSLILSMISESDNENEKIESIGRYNNKYQALKNDVIDILQQEMREIIAQQLQHNFSKH